MIRVLQVIGVMDRGGAETMIMNLYRTINRDKIQFDFLVHEQREGDYDAEIRELGGHIFRVPRFTGLNERSYRLECRSLFVKHPEWSIVHGHIGSCASIYLTEAKRAGKVSIAHSHAQNYETGLPGLAFLIASYPVRYIADYFIGCSSEAGIDRFGKKVVEGDRYFTLANGINARHYACAQKSHNLAKEKYNLVGRPVVCHVGRLTAVKNHEFLFDVFEQIRQRWVNAVLLLAGRGELEESLRQSVARRGLTESVHCLGVVEDVVEVLRASDLFVFPSVKEGLPLAVVEAQASGLPTVMSTGVPESALMGAFAQRVPLDEGAEKWGRICVQYMNNALSHERHDGVELVRSRGFDIEQTSKWLEAFYVRVAKEIA